MADADQPVFRAPKSAPTKWTVDELKKHLQTAMLVELYTIPQYLFAAYSIQDNALATYKILTVVRQEMLHLSLAGNTLCAIGGEPRVYGPEYTPRYPAEIFYERIEMNLKAATRDTILTFKRIESPPDISRAPEKPWLIPQYNTIGEFYQHTLRGLKTLSDQHADLYKPDSIAKQFQAADGSWYDDSMVAITDKTSAVDALTLVIEQGEGTTGQGVPIKYTFQTHYEIFDELSKKDIMCYDVIENPITEEWEGKPVYPVMKAFDAAYSYLLLTMETTWRYSGPRRQELVTNNIMSLMLTVLKPLALFLVKQEIDPATEQHAAPAFNLHEFESTAKAYGELKKWTDDAVKAYPNEAELQTVQRAVGELIDLGSIGNS